MFTSLHVVTKQSVCVGGGEGGTFHILMIKSLIQITLDTAYLFQGPMVVFFTDVMFPPGAVDVMPGEIVVPVHAKAQLVVLVRLGVLGVGRLVPVVEHPDRERVRVEPVEERRATIERVPA